MDPLSEVFTKIKLSSAVYFKSDFTSPWGMDIPKGPFAQFHIVTRGQCILKTHNESLSLFTGDIVIFPLGTSHWIADSASSQLENGQVAVESIMKGASLFKGDIVATTLICGHFDFDRNMDHPFIKELPEVIHITDAERKEKVWLESIANLIIQEAGSDSAGNSIIVNKLGEVLFIHAIRAFFEKNTGNKGFLAAIQDDRIGKALQAIHASPNTDWSLVTLAKVSGMSRTSFSNHFKALVGDTPLTYITKWRVLQARELLKETSHSVGEIAERVGYQSEAAFNRVFKKMVAQTPLRYRKSA